jgi:hypothetical protein
MDAHPFIKQAENFQQTPAYQKADVNCCLGQERIAYGGIHATRYTKVYNVIYYLYDSSQKIFHACLQHTAGACQRRTR